MCMRQDVVQLLNGLVTAAAAHWHWELSWYDSENALHDCWLLQETATYLGAHYLSNACSCDNLAQCTYPSFCTTCTVRTCFRLK